ncbi:MAG: DUF58 domain-containing protein [Pseudomonadota bacterium]
MQNWSQRLRGRPSGPDPRPATADPRIRVDLAHLRALAARARGLSFLPRQPSASVLNGRHASRMRGRGLSFEELRGYLPGDDVRAIDWKVTARMGAPYIRVFTEERDRPALLVVDQRLSMFFGSVHAMKSVTAAEAAALAAAAVLAQGDRLGGIVFGDRAIAEIRPERSRRAQDRLLKALVEAGDALDPGAEDAPLPLSRPLEAVSRIARQNHLVVILSDFDGIDAPCEALLRSMARHNDVVLVLVTDPLANAIPAGLRITVSNGRLLAALDTDDAGARQALTAFAGGRIARIEALARRNRIPLLPLSAGAATLPQMRRLFGLRPGTGR